MRNILLPPAVLLLLFGHAAPGQSIGIGVKGGIRVTDDFQPGTSGTESAASESKRYVVGPMVTFGLPLGFKAEFDALYRHVAFRAAGGGAALGTGFTQRRTAASWEFPILLRHNFLGGLYGGVGYAPRVIHGSSHVNVTNLVTLVPATYGFQQYTSSDPYQTTHALVLVGELEERFRKLELSPEVRYTHWWSHALDVSGPYGFGYRVGQEQVDIAIGITYRPLDGR